MKNKQRNSEEGLTKQIWKEQYLKEERETKIFMRKKWQTGRWREKKRKIKEATENDKKNVKETENAIEMKDGKERAQRGYCQRDQKEA